jgi:hypothetical protein
MADLSPAAKALDAYNKLSLNSRQWHDGIGPLLKLAAALRAIADQVAPIQRPIGSGFRQHRSATAERLAIRRELLAIAAELENING